MALLSVVGDGPRMIAAAAVEMPFSKTAPDDVLVADQSDLVAAGAGGSIRHRGYQESRNSLSGFGAIPDMLARGAETQTFVHRGDDRFQ